MGMTDVASGASRPRPLPMFLPNGSIPVVVRHPFVTKASPGRPLDEKSRRVSGFLILFRLLLRRPVFEKAAAAVRGPRTRISWRAILASHSL
jgi:hypothetical protein